MFSSAVGDGKTTGAAWRCYTGTERVLWLDAPAVGGADAKAHRANLRAVGDAGLVVLDDVGASGSTGEYEAPKVIALLTLLVGRPQPSIATCNLSRPAFGVTFDAEEHGRLVDRFTMAPNRFVELPPTEQSKRATAVEPPDTLPPRERAAQNTITALDHTRSTAQAFTMGEVSTTAVRFVARALGVRTDADLDARIAEHDRARTSYCATVAAAGGTTT